MTLAGCAGQVDLSKSVSNRTTVKASGSFGDEALRVVDPCKLLTDQLLNSIGKKVADPTNRRGYSECAVSIKDSTGKSDISLTVKVGEDLFSAPKQAGKTISGLPVYESRTTTGCNVSAVTGRDPSRGLVAVGIWEGGDPCVAANKVIESVINQIGQGPPTYEETPGSLVSLDPCTALDDSTATTVLGGAPEKLAAGIRSCNYRGKGVMVDVRYSIDGDPFAYNTYSPTKVDLTDKVKGAAQWKSTISPNRCQIEWVHRALSGSRGENVNVSYERSPPDPKDDLCAKTLVAAKAVAGKLPQS